MNRKYYVDAAKVVGLLCIVLAHVSPPGVIAQIRNFDVPLMVMLSAILACDAYERTMHSGSFCEYVKKRFTRLVLPVWLFLIPFVLGRVVLTHDLTAGKIIGSFLLGRNSIGYVWVIMVYLICSLLVPFLRKINIFSIKHLAIVAGVYILFEVVCTLGLTTTISAVDDILFYIVPYGCVTLLGLNYEKLSRKTRLWTAACAFGIFAIMAGVLYMQTGRFVYTQDWKYPARIYYLAYAIAVSLLVLEGLQMLPEKTLNNKITGFISRSSLWIYLWHILVLWLMPACSWPIRFVLVFMSSCVITVLQGRVVNFLERKSFPKSLLKILKG